MGTQTDRARPDSERSSSARRDSRESARVFEGAQPAPAALASSRVARATPDAFLSAMFVAGEATREEAVSRMQSSHGNLAVQRMVDGPGTTVQRQDEEEEYLSGGFEGSDMVRSDSGQGPLMDIFDSVVGGASGAVSSLEEGAWGAVESLGSGALGVGESLYSGASGAWDDFSGGVASAGSSLWSGLEEAAPGAISGVGSLLSGDWESGLGGLWDAGTSVAGSAWDAGGQLVSGGLEAGSDIWGGLSGAAASAEGGVMGARKSWREGVGGARSSVFEAGGNIWDTIKQQAGIPNFAPADIAGPFGGIDWGQASSSGIPFSPSEVAGPFGGMMDPVESGGSWLPEEQEFIY